MREQRRAWALQDNAYTLHSGFVQCSLLSHPLWAESSAILAYMSHQGEVDTSLVLQRAWAEGKQVFLPRCVPDKTGRMESVPCQNIKNLHSGAYGIAEPLGPALPCPDKTLVLVPGLAFDTKGHRLGYGGGFYDRFLLDKPSFISVGLAFFFQVVEEVPHESWDCPLHALCTEETLQWI